jgi:hypothetical protein
MLPPLLTHPAPGLHFPVHKSIPGSKPYTISSPHRINPPPTPGALHRLRSLTAHDADLQRDVLSIYEIANGFDVCRVLFEDITRPALTLHAIEYWDMWTQQLDITFESFLADLRHVYIPGHYHVIGAVEGEESTLVLFTRGEHEGRPIAGNIFCVALDGYLGYLEPVAMSLPDLIAQIGADPLPLLAKFPWTHTSKDDQGNFCGSVPDRYISDIRNETDIRPDLAPPDEPPEPIPDVLRL